MSSDVLELKLMQASLSLSHICAKEARRVNSPDSKLTLVHHAIGFLNTAYRLVPYANRPTALRREVLGSRNYPPAREESE